MRRSGKTEKSAHEGARSPSNISRSKSAGGGGGGGILCRYTDRKDFSEGDDA